MRFTGTPYIEGWGGCHVQVYVTEVKAFGEVVDALRIRPQQPVMEKPVLNADHKRWGEAVKAYTDALDKGAKLQAMRKHWNISDNVAEQLNAA